MTRPSISAMATVLWGALAILTGPGSEPAQALDSRLDGVPVVRPASVPYRRMEDFGGWRQDVATCLDTRGRALRAASLIPVTVSPQRRGHCTVRRGQWRDPYTGAVFTDPMDVDVDHVVPLKEAWNAGANGWSASKRRAFANDLGEPGHLLVVSARANRAKGDRDPATWMPPDRRFHCAYALDWIAIKKRWKLSADPAEIAALDGVLRGCRP